MQNTTPLTLNKEFKRAYYRGRCQAAPVLVVYMLKNRAGGKNRLGLTATKKVGTAVQRNRARRLMKEAYRLLEAELPKGYDYVLVVRTKTAQARMQDVRAALKSAVAKLLLKK